jgi:hypothetical protein
VLKIGTRTLLEIMVIIGVVLADNHMAGGHYEAAR